MFVNLHVMFLGKCVHSSWNAWGQCSAICGGGVQFRHRHVTHLKISPYTMNFLTPFRIINAVFFNADNFFESLVLVTKNLWRSRAPAMNTPVPSVMTSLLPFRSSTVNKCRVVTHLRLGSSWYLSYYCFVHIRHACLWFVVVSICYGGIDVRCSSAPVIGGHKTKSERNFDKNNREMMSKHTFSLVLDRCKPCAIGFERQPTDDDCCNCEPIVQGLCLT